MERRNVNGAAVRAIREALGHPGSQFATKATMSHALLCNVEAGRRQPSVDAAARIVAHLGVDATAITYPVVTAPTAGRRINGATVRALREALQVPGGEFAGRIQISHAYLTNVEAGRKQPSAAVIRRIADELGVPLAAITYPVLSDRSEDVA